MRTKHIILITLSLFSFSALKAQEANTNSFNLQEAISYGLENSTSAEEARINKELYENQAYTVITEGLPKVNGKIEYTNNFILPTQLIPAEFFGGQPGEFEEIQFGTQHNAFVGADLQQLIVDGRYFVGLAARAAVLDVADLNYQLEVQDLQVTITQAYYQALVAQESESLLSGNLTTVTALLGDTRAMYEEGFVEELEVDRLELALSNIETRIANAQKQASNALDALKFQMGMPLDEELILEESLDDLLAQMEVSAMPELNPDGRIEYDLLNTQVSLREYDIKQQRAGYYPSLYGFASYGLQAQRDEFDFFGEDSEWYDQGAFGFTLNVPIFDGLTKNANIQKAKFNLEMAKNSQAMFEQSVQLEVSVANTNYLNAYNEYNNQKENLELAQKIYDKASIKYTEGVGSSLELSQAEQELTTTQINYINSIYNLLNAKTQLDKALGKL